MRRFFVLSIAMIGLVVVAGQAQAANVALFFNPTYVDTSPAPNGEATNLRDTLLALGFTVNTFTGITADAISAATVGQQVLMYPELEVRDLSPDLDLNASFTIGFFVYNGGTLVVCNQADGDPLAVINKAFSGQAQPPNQVFQLTAVPVVPPYTRTSAANGTPFASGPATLPPNNIVSGVLKASLPAAAKIIYADANGNAVVVWIPNFGGVTGNGNVIVLGWDWFDATTTANPGGQPSDEWNAVLNVAANFASVPPVPTLSEWAMMAMAALLLLVGLRTLRRGPRPAGV